MNPPGRRFRDGVGGVGFLSTQTDLDDAGILHHELPDGLPADAPKRGEFTDAIVFFERGVVLRH